MRSDRVDVPTLERTPRILGTRTETETIRRAPDLVTDEAALIEARPSRSTVAP